MTSYYKWTLGPVLCVTALAQGAAAPEGKAGLAPRDWSQIRQALRKTAPTGSSLVHEAQLFGRSDRDATAAQSGYAVAVSGDTAVVGSILEATAAGTITGAVHVFVRSGGTWIEQQRLVPEGGGANDLFGCAVAVSGDTVVVGAFGHDTGGASNSGSAYVFARSGSSWSQQAELQAPVPEAEDAFGFAVAVSGDTALVGAVDDDTVEEDAGSVYVFVRSGASWALQRQLKAPDPVQGQLFGAAVSIDGDTALVGAPLDPEDGLEAGAAYVFVRSGANWTAQHKLLASDGADMDQLGSSVSLSGDTAVAGSIGADTPAGPDTGAAYVFVRSGTTWTEEQKLAASDAATFDAFGISLSVSGDSTLVGAWSADPPAGQDAGAAYVFVRSGTTWTEQQKVLAGDGAAQDAFGYSVALDGDMAVVGARRADTPDGTDAGAAYAFVRAGTAWTERQKLLGSETPQDGFGSAVALSGDTVVVGAHFDDAPGGQDAGSAYVFVRSGPTWSLQQKLVAADGLPGDYFGISVSVSGDTVVVGARMHDTHAAADIGAAYVFVRAGGTWTLQQELMASDGAAADTFGASVSVSGDTLVVGAPVADTVGGVDAGAVYAFVRSGSTWTEQQKLLPPDGRADLDFGFSASLSGDTVVIGAPSDDTSVAINTGSAYVFVRAGATWSFQQKLLAPDAAEGDDFGFAVSASGDTAAVGAFADDTAAGVDTGSAYVFVRSGTTWSLQQKLVASDAASGDYFGFSVSVFADALAVGSLLDDTAAGVDAGSAYVFLRSAGAWTELGQVTAPDGRALDFFGKSVAVWGDTLVSGAHGDDTAGGLDAGSAHVFRGSLPVELQAFTVE